MKRKVAIFSAVVLLASPLGAGAMELKLYNEYKNNPGSEKVAELYLHGIGQGYLWANAQLETTGRAKIFCMPGHLEMSAGLVKSVLESEISRKSRERPYSLDMVVEPIALWGFMRTFPCN